MSMVIHNIKFDIRLDSDMDEDEIEMYAKKLKKSLSELKIKDQSIISIQGTDKEGNEQCIYVQIIENPELTEDYLST